ncbi:hypothetical protein BpHYR1_023012 [Brachionus plicatilis]|uniref:Uncharacterized protein n=1 Tax=Brachionus plicatilis TaxID=10195 RepID=A0A3M7QFN0_BRAPC|nr:hypothetical protein BpHYR1_023012 [Brachionus plicatilis]
MSLIIQDQKAECSIKQVNVIYKYLALRVDKSDYGWEYLLPKKITAGAIKSKYEGQTTLALFAFN